MLRYSASTETREGEKGRPKSKQRIGRRWKMKLTWKNNKKRPLLAVSQFSNLPFENQQDNDVPQHQQEAVKDADNDEESAVKNQNQNQPQTRVGRELLEARQLSKEFQSQGDKFAEDGKYREALGKWETAITLTPEVAVLHEQKAQILLEIGDAWNALKAATRATELEPSWAEGWITLGRAQLNFGEPDSAIESFDRALAVKSDCEEAREDRKTALHLVKRRKQLHSSGMSTTRNRFVVGDKDENS